MKEMFRKRLKFILIIIFIVSMFGGTLNFGVSLKEVEAKVENNPTTLAANLDKTEDFVYLSDLDYMTESGMSQNGWSGHSIQKDKNQEGGELSLIVNGEKRPYVKGVSIHARGWATYDISELSTEYPRFIAKIGVDGGRGTAGSIKYTIYVSNDLSTWDTLLATPVLTGSSEAVNVDVNVEGYKYLRIYVDPNGANTSDHGTIANAKFVKEDYVEQEVSYAKIHKTEYYDEILRRYDAEYNLEHNYRLILEREFVNKIGYWTIQNKVEYSPEYIDTLDWLLASNERLGQIIEVGEVRSGMVFLDTIHKIYSEYKDELKTENGYVYQKMLIGLAAAYKTDNVASPLTFSTAPREYDVLERFRLMKLLFDTGKFQRPEEFKTYHVELMRFIMQDAISNEELIWLNEYSRTKADPFNKYSYISYRYNPSYNQKAYQDPANKTKYDTKYLLSQYGVPYGDGVVRYWMAFEYGGICWNISRIGQTINKIKGIPSVGIYQPDHEAYIIYSQRADGTGIWTQNYNIFGWGKSSTKWWGGNRYRLLLNWSDKYFSNQVMNSSNYGTSSGYLLLGQAALNRREEWTKSLYLNYLANSYTNDEDKLEIYNKALDSLDINLDSYDYIINLYKRTNRSSAEWHELADKIIDAYTYYPNAMYDILKVIKPYLTGIDRVDIDLKEQVALKAATKATDADILQSGPTREIANAILGRARQELASFSFDGANAGKIMINSAYEAYDFNLSYSIDGGKTFSSKTTSHAIALTPEELSKITAENDIIIAMDGTPQRYTIDIVNGTIANNLYGNDLENRVIGVNTSYEWRNSDNEPWTSYKVASPNNTGDKTLHVRVGATGNKLPSEELTFTFTADNQPETRKYVSVSHYSIHAYSTQSQDKTRPYYAPNAIDGNGNTFWHTDYGQNVLLQKDNPFITIKLDKPRFISAVEFKQVLDPKRPSDPDPIKNARIYVSEDGENWTLGGQIENCPKDKELRVIDFDESIYGEYVKIEMDTYNMFASIALVNIFQDLTQNPRPTAGIGYSTTEPTNKNVVARLINPSTEIEITSIVDKNGKILDNSGSDTYIFENNGEVTFHFRDKAHPESTGTSTAVVNWIDRTAPTATIKYNTTSPTNKTVYSTLEADEEVTVINNTKFSVDDDGNVLDAQGNILENYTVDDKGVVKNPEGVVVGNTSTLIHEFYTNGEFVYEFVDKAGNKGTATAKVDWIDFEAPEATLTYDRETLTNRDVTVTISFDEKAIVTNNNGSTTYTFKENGEFTFEYKDLAGNTGTITAKVTWIDKVAPTVKLDYSTKQSTKNPVTVTLTSDEDIIITNNSGKNTYTFKENGSFTFTYKDKLGNKGKITANVNWIEKTTKPTDKPTKPSTNTNNNTNSNSNVSTNTNTNGNTNSNTNTNPTEKKYKDYSLGNIKVSIPEEDILENVTLKKNNLALTTSLKKKFDSNSEYFELYLENSSKEKVNLDSSKVKTTIELDTSKEFLGFYEVTNGSELKALDYKKISTNKIEVETEDLGKYIISYKEKKQVSTNANVNVKENDKKSNILIWIAIGGVLIALGTAIVIGVKKSRKN